METQEEAHGTRSEHMEKELAATKVGVLCVNHRQHAYEFVEVLEAKYSHLR